jgi:chorismate mutase
MTEQQSQTLAGFRTRLDVLDERLLQVLIERSALVGEVWAWKAAQGVSRVDAGREAEVVERLLAAATAHGLDRDAVQPIIAAVVGRRLRR